MAYCTERHKMEFRLLECVVEPPSISSSSDVTASSTESDGDAPVIDVSHSRSDRPTDHRHRPCQSRQPLTKKISCTVLIDNFAVMWQPLSVATRLM